MTRAGDERSLIEHISTHWSSVEDPPAFVLRYATAIRQYIDALLQGTGDADDVTQDFLAAVMSRRYSDRALTRGRFRDYLRAAIRQAVAEHRRVPTTTSVDPAALDDAWAADDAPWIDSWRTCLIDAAWLKLRQYQRANDGNCYHTVLELAAEYPHEESAELAQRAAQALGRPMRADAYRQQVHRARRKLAEYLVAEVRETLRELGPQEIADELREIGLMPYVEGFVQELG